MHPCLQNVLGRSSPFGRNNDDRARCGSRLVQRLGATSASARAAVVPFLATLALLAAERPARAQELSIRDGSPAVVETLTARATVEEGIALVELDQTFRNPDPIVREGVWTVRLPEDAVVHSFSMWMDGREKQGRVLEAGKARAIYDSIVRKRRDPGLVEEIGWRTFRVSVFPIPARDTVRIRLVYAQVVPDDLGLHELSIPLPAAARTQVAVLDVSATITAAAGLAVLDAPGAKGAHIVRDGPVGTVRWADERVRPTGPFVVRFAPKSDGFGVSLLTDCVADDGDGTFVVRIVPRIADPPEIPRDVVFVIDCSGSMEGPKIEQARAALLHGLATLAPQDRFAVVAFATGVTAPAGGLRAADEAGLAAGRATAAALDATGGTNIADALDVALGLREKDPAHRLFTVVLLTDGDPTIGETDPDRIVARWRAKSDRNVRLFAVGVGADVKDFLLTRLAEGSRGAAEYLLDDARLEVKVSALFSRIRTPVLVDPSIEVRGVAVRSVEPRPLPDVFRGSAVTLAGRFTGSGRAEIVLRGRSGRQMVETVVPVTFPSAPTSRPHVAQLWARARIDRLLDDLRASDTGGSELRNEIVGLGIRYQVVTPYTSFLVVEDGVVIPDDRETARVPDADPDDTASGAPSSGGGGGPRTGGPVDRGGASRGGASADSREPSDPPPAPDGAGPGTPGGADEGGPVTGGGEVGGPSTGGGASALGRGSGATSASAAGGLSSRRPRRIEMPDWPVWWSNEAPAFLAAATESAAPRLDPEFVTARLVPLLRARAFDRSERPRVRAAAIDGLARLGHDAEDFRVFLAECQDGLGEAPVQVVGQACLAAVSLGDRSPETRARLLAAATEAKRRTADRAFAAVALGLLGAEDDGRTVRALAAAIDPPEMGPPIAAALGLLGDPAAVPFLVARIEAQADDVEAAWCIAALGRLGVAGASDTSGSPAVTRLLRTILMNGNRSDVVRRAVPRALDGLFRAADVAERSRIVTVLLAGLDDADATVAAECALALGRIAAMDECPRYTAKSIVARLAGAHREARLEEFGRIGLAFAARGQDRERPLGRLRSALPAELAAFPGLDAVTWMLAGDDAMASATTGRDTRDEQIARHLLAMAVLRPAAADAAIRRFLTRQPEGDVWIDAMDAVSVAGCGADASRLVDVLLDPNRRPRELPSTGRALGRIGDASAAARLLQLVVAPDRRADAARTGDAALVDDAARAAAIDALARMAAPRSDPRLRFCERFPHRAWSLETWEVRSAITRE